MVSLPLASLAADRKPESKKVSKVAAAPARAVLPSSAANGARTRVLASGPIVRLAPPVNYAMPSMPKPEQSLVPDVAKDRPMTTLEYASTLKAPLGLLRVSSSYGLRMHPLAQRELFHQGIDYASPLGTPIRAAQEGQIKEMQGRKGFGFVARISHSHGVETVYGHMLKFMPSLKKGSVVRRGDIIGFVGSTGRSTGPHLHFEVLADGKQVDPLRLTMAFAPDRLLALK
ncbi:M23 family metallopeptidase [Nevskia sp.]|uniref:M23 family metallopeptidase n=1 Tax=Nevskia sp. TaxID=1929292 RepID=UPI0025CE5346|nr:M23 family metallopeptidase [Nevskia sp.]